MKRFKEKVAIITGGAQGIGEATTRRLANEGAMTAILDIQLDNAQAVAEEILSQGGKKSIAVKMDVTDSQEVKRAVREVEETFGRVDVLINNVGLEELGLFIESTEESWDWKIAVNLRGPMTVTKAVLEGMVPRKYGRIVNISSDAGRAGQFGEAAYGAAKAGIIALTKAWARELMEHNITVNSVSPFAMTPGSALNGKRWRESNAFKKSPPSPPKLYSKTGKGTPEEMAAAVAFFASDEASYITGQTLSVNGGRFMF
jgi:2-hydroxycyclohexanecarboxyl-CoA dehydrogenase